MGILLVLAAFVGVGLFATYRIWGAGPQLVSDYDGTVAQIWPRFIEYGMALDAVELLDHDSGNLVARAVRGSGAFLGQVRVAAGDDLLRQFRQARWTIEVPRPAESEVFMAGGRRYKLRIRANNGFGLYRYSSCDLVAQGPRVEAHC